MMNPYHVMDEMFGDRLIKKLSTYKISLFINGHTNVNINLKLLRMSKMDYSVKCRIIIGTLVFKPENHCTFFFTG